MSRFHRGSMLLLVAAVCFAACGTGSTPGAGSPDVPGPGVESGAGGAQGHEAGVEIGPWIDAASGSGGVAGQTSAPSNGGAGGATSSAPSNGGAGGATSSMPSNGGAGGAMSSPGPDASITTDGGPPYPLCRIDAGSSSCRGASASYCVTATGATCVCDGTTWICPPTGPKTTEEALTGAYRGENNQSCWTCAQEKCLSTALAEACEDALSTNGCVNVLACELESGCAFTSAGVLSCYCGSASPLGDCLYTDHRNGVCLTEIQNSSSYTTSVGVLSIYTSPNYGLGVANSLMACLVHNGCTSCLKQHGDNLCPVANAFAVPGDMFVGQSGVLSGQGSDLDDGPFPTTLAWSTSPAGGATIAASSAGETTYTCTSAGSNTVTFAISDGDSACTWTKSRSIRCYDYSLPAIDLDVSSRAALTGGSIAVAVKPAGGARASGYSWSASNDVGELDTSNPERAVLTCTKPGIVTVTVSAHGVDGGRGTEQSVGITCLDPSGGPTVAPASTRSALVGDYRGLDNQACWTCATRYCVDTNGTLPCEYRQDPVERKLCLGLLQCELESGCGADANFAGLTSCYCSRGDGCWTDVGAHDGACARDIENALQSTDVSYIASHSWSSETLPGDLADALTYCLALNGCTSCFSN